MNHPLDNCMDELLLAYVDCALWSSTDGNDRPLDEDFSRGDIAPSTVEAMVRDCEKFRGLAGGMIAGDEGRASNWMEIAGHPPATKK